MKKLALATILAASTLSVTGCSVFGSSAGNVTPPSNNTVKTVEQNAGQTTNKALIYNQLNALHDDANNWVGWGHTPKWANWDTDEQTRFLPAVEKVKHELAGAAQNATTKAVAHDLNNAEALLKIAESVHQRQPLLYFHRIMSDLANYVYSTNKGEEYFGATHALKGAEANTIDAYVAKNS